LIAAGKPRFCALLTTVICTGATSALESMKYAVTSTPLADDGLREGAPLDGNRDVIVVDILGGIGTLSKVPKTSGR